MRIFCEVVFIVWGAVGFAMLVNDYDHDQVKECEAAKVGCPLPLLVVGIAMFLLVFGPIMLLIPGKKP